MKHKIQILMSGIAILLFGSHMTVAQKIDDERMIRDIEVAENVLGTLIKQEFNNQSTFFPLEIRGSYQAGYGVTFSLPADYTTPIVLINSSSWDNGGIAVGSDSYLSGSDLFSEDNARNSPNKTMHLESRENKKKRLDMDSVRDAYNLKVIAAAKSFLVDYSDMITQLSPQERIIITNQGNQPRVWVNQYFNAPKRTHLSVEVLRSDITQFKQGKINREQALAKVKVINTETVDTVEPDLELLSSIFGRLYRPDLSKTYFIGDNVYYERLKDFGVIYYMQVFGSSERDFQRFIMPTIGLEDVDLETRNKKVTELYPKFEKELKENILEYGKTIKSLKDNEVLVFQVMLTRCKGCGIPSTLEASIKSSDLKEYAAGKMDKNAAFGKFSLKKGASQ